MIRTNCDPTGRQVDSPPGLTAALKALPQPGPGQALGLMGPALKSESGRVLGGLLPGPQEPDPVPAGRGTALWVPRPEALRGLGAGAGQRAHWHHPAHPGAR